MSWLSLTWSLHIIKILPPSNWTDAHFFRYIFVNWLDLAHFTDIILLLSRIWIFFFIFQKKTLNFSNNVERKTNEQTSQHQHQIYKKKENQIKYRKKILRIENIIILTWFIVSVPITFFEKNEILMFKNLETAYILVKKKF